MLLSTSSQQGDNLYADGAQRGDLGGGGGGLERDTLSRLRGRGFWGAKSKHFLSTSLFQFKIDFEPSCVIVIRSRSVLYFAISFNFRQAI